jgi:hypothetical protein
MDLVTVLVPLAETGQIFVRAGVILPSHRVLVGQVMVADIVALSCWFSCAGIISWLVFLVFIIRRFIKNPFRAQGG